MPHDVYIKTLNSAVHEDLLYVIEKILNDLKDLKNDKKTSLKRKEEEISQLSAKVKRLTDDSEYLIRMAEEQPVEAEKKTSFKFIKKSNAFRDKAKTKISEKNEVVQKINVLKLQKLSSKNLSFEN